MYKQLIALSLCGILTACSTLGGEVVGGVAKGIVGGDTPSLDATVQLGKENHSSDIAVTERREVITDDVAGDVKVTHNTVTNIPLWVGFLMGCLGILMGLLGLLINPFTVKRLLFTTNLE